MLSPLVAAARPYVGNLAYAALASGFLMTDILSLRILLFGGYSGLVTYHALQANPMRIPLLWSAFFVAVNAYKARELMHDLNPGAFSEEDEQLYNESFSQLTRGQFKRFIECGERVSLPSGTTLTEERKVCGRLFFVLDGAASMSLNGVHTTTIVRGGFVNTLAVQQGAWQQDSAGVPSYGTIRSSSDATTAISWDLNRLGELLRSDPELERRVNHVLVAALMRRLLRSRDGDVVADSIGRFQPQEQQPAAALPRAWFLPAERAAVPSSLLRGGATFGTRWPTDGSGAAVGGAQPLPPSMAQPQPPLLQPERGATARVLSQMPAATPQGDASPAPQSAAAAGAAAAAAAAPAAAAGTPVSRFFPSRRQGATSPVDSSSSPASGAAALLDDTARQMKRTGSRMWEETRRIRQSGGGAASTAASSSTARHPNDALAEAAAPTVAASVTMAPAAVPAAAAAAVPASRSLPSLRQLHSAPISADELRAEAAAAEARNCTAAAAAAAPTSSSADPPSFSSLEKPPRARAGSGRLIGPSRSESSLPSVPMFSSRAPPQPPPPPASSTSAAAPVPAASAVAVAAATAPIPPAITLDRLPSEQRLAEQRAAALRCQSEPRPPQPNPRLKRSASGELSAARRTLAFGNLAAPPPSPGHRREPRGSASSEP